MPWESRLSLVARPERERNPDMYFRAPEASRRVIYCSVRAGCGKGISGGVVQRTIDIANCALRLASGELPISPICLGCALSHWQPPVGLLGGCPQPPLYSKPPQHVDCQCQPVSQPYCLGGHAGAKARDRGRNLRDARSDAALISLSPKCCARAYSSRAI